MQKIYLSIVLLIVTNTLFSQAEYLDKTFGNNGYAVTNFKGGAVLNSIAIQVDGKIVAAGTNNGNFAVSRYNADGSTDNSFGTNGKVVTDLGNTEDAGSLVLQADGKIIV